MRQTRADGPFAIDAWVVRPDHLHCISILSPEDRDHTTGPGAIKAWFSISICRASFSPTAPVGAAPGGVTPALRRKDELGLLQPYNREYVIRDHADHLAHLRCDWMNPVR